jgi:putative membrane protein
MKAFLRTILFNSFSIFILSQALPGVKVHGGPVTLLFGGLALTLLLVLVKPVLNLLSLPLNIVTLGFFSVFTNIIIFYLLTILVVGISITDFTYPGISYAGFVIPKIYVGTLFAFALASFLQSLAVSFLTWLIKK